jgi:hypothetical protein
MTLAQRALIVSSARVRPYVLHVQPAERRIWPYASITKDSFLEFFHCRHNLVSHVFIECMSYDE